MPSPPRCNSSASLWQTSVLRAGNRGPALAQGRKSSIPVLPHYFENLSPVLSPADLPSVPHGALQPGALLLEQRMGFIRELQYRGIGRCRVPANSQQQFDRCPARELVEIDAGQFAKFRCGGSVLSLAHSLEPLTAGHDLPPLGSFPLRNLLGVDLTKLMLAVRPAAGIHTARDRRPWL